MSAIKAPAPTCTSPQGPGQHPAICAQCLDLPLGTMSNMEVTVCHHHHPHHPHTHTLPCI